MSTYYQSVGPDQLEALKADPDSINRLDQPEDRCNSMHGMSVVSHFLCGSAWVGPEDGPLAIALHGAETVNARTLELGFFTVVRPEAIAAVATALGAVALDPLLASVAETDLQELSEDEEAELDELEMLLDAQDDIPGMVVDEVRALSEFYSAAAKRGDAVVIYST